MKLSDFIHVNTHYTRSINLERDWSSEDVLRSYIPTTRSLHVLSRIIATLNGNAMPRAWALIGPYGSGKSSFAVFLSHLLGNKSPQTRKYAQEILQASDPKLGRKLHDETNQKTGHCTILLTGSPEPLGKRLLHAIYKGANAYWQGRRGRPPRIILKLEQAISTGTYTTSEIIELLSELQNAIADSNGNGILIVIDELGKFLEFEARHHRVNDIYLLQAIAERACSECIVPLNVVVLLHQSFEQYARGLGETLKNEWQKVQGRFESIPFLESAEQVLRILRTTILQKFDKRTKKIIADTTHSIVKTLSNAKALPNGMDINTAWELFQGCYPLHPVTLLVLPVLCQRVAQNERTLFSYLGSTEIYGFKDSLSKLEWNNGPLPWILPWEIYEYFILNQPNVVSDHLTHRRWTEVVTAVERLGDVHESEVRFVKTIGLFNIMGQQGGFKASEEILSLCDSEVSAYSKKKISKILSQLESKSIITFRKYSGEYRVWQGSDFDPQAALQNELSQLAELGLADVLNEQKPLLPIVARRYTIATGSLQYFRPLFLDSRSLENAKIAAGYPHILIFLSESPENDKALIQEAKKISGGINIAAICKNGAEIRQAIIEVIGLIRVQRNSQELSNDPVSQRELRDMLNAAILFEQQLIKNILNEPDRNHWFWGEQELSIKNKRALQIELSKILETVFNQTPLIHNELINRDKPSTSAIAGRNKLFAAMIDHGHVPNLGIQKYPAEKAIYKSVLLATALHRHCDGLWKFCEPPVDKDSCRILPTWQAINKFIERSEQWPLPISNLFVELQYPPYGVKAGLIPILFMTAYLSRQHEIALYEEELFCPTFNIEILERLIKKPESFSIQLFRLSGMRASIYEKYMKVIVGSKKSTPNLLEVVRPMAKFMMRLPEYTKHTNSISKEAQNFRAVFFVAKSPANLLFTEIPRACGYPPFNPDQENNELADEFTRSFVKILQELKNAYPNLLFTVQEKLISAFPDCKGLNLTKLREQLRGRYIGLDKYTIDTEGLRAFVLRLCDTYSEDAQWLESLMAFLGRKPADKWNDEDLQVVDFRLAEFSKRLRDLEKLRIAYEDNKARLDPNFQAVLVRLIRQGEIEREQVVYINEERQRLFAQMAPVIHAELRKLPDEHQQLALLADLFEQIFMRIHEKNKSVISISAKQRKELP